MKIISLILSLLLIPSIALAIDYPGRYGFKAYSSADAKECAIYGMTQNLYSNFDRFAPRSDFSRTLSLGTKGYANYSTVGRGAIRFTCRVVGTATAAAVKVQVGGFLNGAETHFLTLSSEEFVTVTK